MNRQNAILLGVAVFVGLIAVYLVNAYFTGMENEQEAVLKETRLTKVVVATQPIEFGGRITNTNSRLADWPAGAVPVGAFTRLEDALNNRVALRPLVAGEPIIADRVSGTDGRATIAANLPDGQYAVAVPISDVSGVAGFVRPGDAVDVLLTRQIPGDGAGNWDKMTDVLMQGVPVLAVGQVANENATEPSVDKTATLQVDLVGAQRLALSRELGTLSLALRNVASQDFGPMRTVTQRDLTASRLFIADRGSGARSTAAPRPASPARSVASAPAGNNIRQMGPTMTVFRGVEPNDYQVSRGF